MKKAGPLIAGIILLAVVGVLLTSLNSAEKYTTVVSGNSERVVMPVEFGKYQDTQCNMLIEKVRDSAQAVSPDGKTWFFDDVGCLALWLEEQKKKDDWVLWVYSRDSKDWIDGRTAWYSRADYTPMHYGFAAYLEQQDGFIDFAAMSLKMLRGENLTDPYVRKELRKEG
jgi:copper chaperone NosL